MTIHEEVLLRDDLMMQKFINESLSIQLEMMTLSDDTIVDTFDEDWFFEEDETTDGESKGSGKFKAFIEKVKKFFTVTIPNMMRVIRDKFRAFVIACKKKFAKEKDRKKAARKGYNLSGAMSAVETAYGKIGTDDGYEAFMSLSLKDFWKESKEKGYDIVPDSIIDGLFDSVSIANTTLNAVETERKDALNKIKKLETGNEEEKDGLQDNVDSCKRSITSINKLLSFYLEIESKIRYLNMKTKEEEEAESKKDDEIKEEDYDFFDEDIDCFR